MRVTGMRIAAAFKAGQQKTLRNTRSTGDKLFLFENCIAYKVSGGDIVIGMCCWPTRTTYDRLQSLCAEYGVAVRFKRIQEALHIITDRGIYPFDARETYSLADIAAGHVAKRDNSDVRADYDMFMKRGWLRVTEQVGV